MLAIVTKGATTILVLVFLVMPACTRSPHGEAKAKRLAADEIPAPVMQAVQARFPDPTIDKASREMERGRVVYDIELRHGGRKHEMDIAADGTVLEVETAIEASQMPEPVRRAVDQRYPGATIREVMRKDLYGDRPQPAHEYEVVLATAQGEAREVTLGPDGSIREESAAD